jgi:hypothetical protein
MLRQLANMLRHSGQLAAVGVLLGCTGCNPFACYQRRTTGMDFYGQRTVTYYHYPHGSWFVPNQQGHHCPTTIELPFHGFSSTCWTRWPEDWQACPPPGPCGVPPGVEVIELPGPPGALPLPPPPLQPSSSNKIPEDVLQLGRKLAFRGQVGFSQPDDENSSAAVVDLTTPTKRSEEEVLQELKASIKPRADTGQSIGSSK